MEKERKNYGDLINEDDLEQELANQLQVQQQDGSQNVDADAANASNVRQIDYSEREKNLRKLEQYE